MSAAQSSWKPPAGDWVPPAADRQAAATPAPVEQPSAAARFFMPFVKMAADAVHYVKNPADAGPVALHLLKLAAEAAIPGYGPQVVGGEIAHGLADPIVHAVKSGDYAGAAGQATLDALMAAAPGAGELGEAAGSAAEMVGTAIKGGIKEGMTPIRYGRLNIPVPSSVAGAAAAGYAGHYLGLPAELSAAVGAVAPVVRGGVRAVRAAMAERAAAEAASEAGFGVASGTTALPTRAVSVSPGIVPEAGGLLPGMRAELEARIAAQQPPGFGVAGGSTAAPTRGVPMTPGVIPDVAGSLPGAPVAASTPVAAAPVEAPPPVAAMPSSVETLRAELEAQFRDGIARANGFKKGFESIPEHNPARQNIQATAAAIARAEQGAPEIAAAPAAAPPPLTGETPNQTPGVQLEPDFLRDEVRRQNTRARTVAEGSQEATAARASHVDDIVGSNRSNWVRKMARQFKNAGMTSEDAAALPAEDLDKVSQAVGVSPWSERSADTIDQFKAALDEMWKNAPKASQKVQDITTTGLGISGSEPTGIGGLMSRKPAAAPAPAPAPDPPPVASSQPTTAGEMMQATQNKGKSMRVYHGTRSDSLEGGFDPEKSESKPVIAWTSKEKGYAEQYGNVSSHKISFQNALDMRDATRQSSAIPYDVARPVSEWVEILKEKGLSKVKIIDPDYEDFVTRFPELLDGEAEKATNLSSELYKSPFDVILQYETGAEGKHYDSIGVLKPGVFKK